MTNWLKLPRWTDFGSGFVLLLLCAYYSFVTYSEKHPDSPRAGATLGESIVKDYGTDAPVAIVVGATQQDRAFATSVEQAVQEAGGSVAATIFAKSPADVGQQLRQLGASNTPVRVIASHHRPAQWGTMQPAALVRLGEAHPSLQGIEVRIPASYYWPTFLTWTNLTNVVKNNADVAIIAIGMTMVIILAGIDLSVGSLLALSSVATAVAIEGWAGGEQAGLVGIAACTLFAVLITTACGLFTGTMVFWLRIPAFIVTLAMMEMVRGASLITSAKFHKAISGGLTEGTPEAIRIHAPSFGWLGNGELVGIPNPIWIMLLLFVAAHIVMTRTSVGRYIYAVGGNAEAARLSGVPVFGIYLFVYAMCGACAGLAGVLDASRFEGGRPNAGEMFELRVIAAVVVGGTSIAGGEGRISWTLYGALIIAVINNGLNMANVSPYEQRVVFGALILAAAVLDAIKRYAKST
jgi:ribose transport system permease protein